MSKRNPPPEWDPQVGEEVWYQFALGMYPGRILARKGNLYVVDRKGSLTVRARQDLWPPSTMARVGDFPPGWETDEKSQ